MVKQLQLAMRKPGKQTQNVPPYIVPLSVQALEIVRHLLDQVVPAQRYLFAHRSDLSKRISENTLNGALRRMGYADQLTGHGMRATISTALNEIGYPKVWGDAQLYSAANRPVTLTGKASRQCSAKLDVRDRKVQPVSGRFNALPILPATAPCTPVALMMSGPSDGAGLSGFHA